MLIGYNTNVPYKGKNYHIQTEDSGMTNPIIVTLLYLDGAILRSKKTSYSHIVGHSDFDKELRILMKHQHREMIRELISGRCGQAQTGEINEPPSQQTEEKVVISEETTGSKRDKSLDDILLEHISKKVKK